MKKTLVRSIAALALVGSLFGMLGGGAADASTCRIHGSLKICVSLLESDGTTPYTVPAGIVVYNVNGPSMYDMFIIVDCIAPQGQGNYRLTIWVRQASLYQHVPLASVPGGCVV